MDQLSVGMALALLSSVTTAAAHAMLKSGKDKLAVRAAIGATATVVMLPVCFLVPLPTSTMLPWLIAASLLHTVYQLVLIRSYESNDFAVAYPISRGIAPVATTVLGIVLLGDRVSPGGIIGALLVSAGIMLIATRGSIVVAGLVAAIVAGLLTTGYTVVDAHAIRLAPQAMTFVAWFFLLDGLLIFPIFVALRRGRARALLVDEGLHGVMAGVVTLVCYGAALLALRIAPVGIVSALRETSVLFALGIAAYSLKERIGRVHLAGGVAIATGALLIVAS